MCKSGWCERIKITISLSYLFSLFTPNPCHSVRFSSFLTIIVSRSPQRLPPRELATGLFIMTEYKPELIKEVLDLLTPQNLRCVYFCDLSSLVCFILLVRSLPVHYSNTCNIHCLYHMHMDEYAYGIIDVGFYIILSVIGTS